ncbi:hypothetical protein [Mesorhizobium loti]|uniref:hypothetical protein n=1 Tax=Rhizobium loti TaxID=381 RepID=UPI00126802A7|nr:hypothetical protein [Mesorhizobium loti]
MTEHRLPGRYKALIAANLAIGIVGILLQPVYPKSIFIAMFVMCVFLTVLLAFMLWKGFSEWKRQSLWTIETSLLVTLLPMALGISLYGMFLTLRSMLK